MTNSEKQPSAEEIIQEVFRLLDEEYLKKHIDDPIETAAASVDVDEQAPTDFAAFIRRIGGFVQAIHFQLKSIQLSTKDAEMEALKVLEFYQGTRSTGFHAAFLDALHPDSLLGIDAVMRQLKEIIKEIERRNYVNWVYTTHIQSQNWHLRCAIVDALFQIWGEWLPPTLFKVPRATLAECIPELMEALRLSEKAVNNIAQTPINYRDTESWSKEGGTADEV